MNSTELDLFLFVKILNISLCLLKNFYIQPLLALNRFISFGSCLTSIIARFLMTACVIRMLFAHIFCIHAISFYSISGNSGFLPFVKCFFSDCSLGYFNKFFAILFLIF